MKGVLRIKNVLPAAWKQNTRLHQRPEFAKYVRRDLRGNLLNPYEALHALCISENAEIVKDGRGPMNVYQEMMFGASVHDPSSREAFRTLLRQY